MCKRFVFLFACVMLVPLPQSASAATYIWTNDYPWSVLWDDALNWEAPGVPGPSDEAVISPPPQRGPAIDSAVNVGDIHGPGWDSDGLS
jgi:hypothetical protein